MNLNFRRIVFLLCLLPLIWGCSPEDGESPNAETVVDAGDAADVRQVDEDVADVVEHHQGLPSYEPGQTYLSETGYVRYVAGDTPIIISVPHGGYDEPEEINDRSGATTVRDAYTLELGQELADAFYEETGRRLHVISLLLARTKLDANRDLDVGAQGDPLAEEVWHEFHAYIDEVKAWAEAEYGGGFYIDLHGHGHLIQRVELGYLLFGSELRNNEEEEISDPEFIDVSSIRTLYYDNAAHLSFHQLLRGPTSFGGLLEERDFPSVPSPATSAPGSLSPYFSGGYNTRRHGSSDGGAISGLQVEANQSVRFDQERRLEFARGLAESIAEFVEIHYRFGL